MRSLMLLIALLLTSPVLASPAPASSGDKGDPALVKLNNACRTTAGADQKSYYACLAEGLQKLTQGPAKPTTAHQLINNCETQAKDRPFRLHRCLIEQYERLEKKTRVLTDKLLGMVGNHRAFGRLKIIQWSNAITKSQSRWHKFITWDCEWPGHARIGTRGAAIAMTKCRIKRTLARVKRLEKRVSALDNLIRPHNDKGN